MHPYFRNSAFLRLRTRQTPTFLAPFYHFDSRSFNILLRHLRTCHYNPTAPLISYWSSSWLRLESLVVFAGRAFHVDVKRVPNTEGTVETALLNLRTSSLRILHLFSLKTTQHSFLVTSPSASTRTLTVFLIAASSSRDLAALDASEG
ncbi:hypothetical protein ONS95_009612 [Cadophora gregata]|uniref:uncharacterized protein n=1 Tax=Cadophora gregata TaxID=51156 RepID=UPI0026DD7EF8|nr:uncharacterized protein ONS95_009612 [Cadophora gregata]KAK0124666.1 hypothetical protein ONS95_009612 [Cadophora gregata]KAK0129474.1 hypothetical protein ONS96_000044 [Cadophora gregata f. sp. sojae]